MKKAVRAFFEKFPAFSRKWRPKWTGYSKVLSFFHVEQQPDGCYHLHVRDKQKDGVAFVWCFVPPADPLSQAGRIDVGRSFDLDPIEG